MSVAKLSGAQGMATIPHHWLIFLRYKEADQRVTHDLLFKYY